MFRLKSTLLRAFVVVASLAASGNARAATLFAGNQHPDFSFQGSGSQNTVYSVAGSRRTAFVPTSMRIWPDTNGAANDPPSYRYLSQTWSSASSDFWLTFRYTCEDLAGCTATGSNYQWFRLLDGGTARLMLRGTGTAGQFKLSKRNSAGTFTDLATSSAGVLNFSYTGYTPPKYDIHVVYAVSGSVDVYQNGTNILSYSGDTTTDSATTLDAVDLGAPTASYVTWWSEVIVDTSDTRSMALWALRPQAAGNTQQWTPSTVGNIAKDQLNDATYISTGTNNNISGWTTPTSAPTGTWTLKSVVQTARLQRSGTGPQNFAWHCRSGGTDAASGDVAASLAFANYMNIWSTNCATAAAWAIGDIASGFNLGIKARP